MSGVKLGRHTLYQNYQAIPKQIKPNFIAADPPWGNTDLDFDKNFNAEVFAHWVQGWMSPTTWLFLFGPLELACIFVPHLRRKFEYVWRKPSPIPQTHNTVHPLINHEMIWAFISKKLQKMNDLYFDRNALKTKGEPYKRNVRHFSTEFVDSNRRMIPEDYLFTNDGYRHGVTVLEHSNKKCMRTWERTDHPTQKPLDLLKLLINAYCPPGGLVLDPTAGSGSTLIACEMTGRTCITAEPNPAYRKIIQNSYKRLLHA